MLIKPMIRSSICLNSHPRGCAAALRQQIKTVLETKQNAAPSQPQPAPLVLVIGCSTGYGLASRIGAAFGYGGATIGLSLEKAPTANKCGTPGYYNNLCFDQEAAKAGLLARTLNGDAYADHIKEETITAVRELAQAGGRKAAIDLVVYSLASPVRTDPKTGVMYRSVIKPIGARYSGKTIDMTRGAVGEASIEPATEEEIAATVKVMGGEDWEAWIDALQGAGVLAPTARTVAYTYLGPEITWPIYKLGTIGRAKEDLERAARSIRGKLAAQGGGAWVSVNKAVVTRASAVIPVIPCYISCLFKVMKERGLHETCIDQTLRLYRERLYTREALEDPAKVPVDAEGRIRLDDWEMREDVQQDAQERMEQVTEENLYALTDIEGFRHDFLEAHGFDVTGIDYEADVNPLSIE